LNIIVLTTDKNAFSKFGSWRVLALIEDSRSSEAWCWRVLGLGTHLFVKVSRPGESEETFKDFF